MARKIWFRQMFWTHDEIVSLHRESIANARRLRTFGAAPWARDNIRASLTLAAECRHALTHNPF